VQEGLEGPAGVGRPRFDGDPLHVGSRRLPAGAQKEAIALASLSKISNTRCSDTIDITL
jgi:hypothetical protein